MTTWTYPAAHTGTPMFSISMTVSVPASVQIGKLREDFMGFCDELTYRRDAGTGAAIIAPPYLAGVDSLA